MNAPEHIRKRFPHARQVALIERYVTRTVRVKKGKRWVKKQVKSAVAVFIITSLDAREAAPVHLAGYVRGQWTIENKVHYAACCRRSGLRPVRMTSAPSARARRAVSSPIPALPPITTTVWPSSSGWRWMGPTAGAVVMIPPVDGRCGVTVSLPGLGRARRARGGAPTS
jgi:hypothetical protein